MDRYWIALAGFRWKVTCYPVKVDVDKPTNVTVLEDLSFEESAQRWDIHTRIILPLKRAVEKVVSLQVQSFTQAGKEPEPIALYIWGAGGDQFDGWSLLEDQSHVIWERVVDDITLVKQWLEAAALPPPRNTLEALMRVNSRHIEKEMERISEEHDQTWDITPVDLSGIENVLDTVKAFRDILCSALVCRGMYTAWSLSRVSISDNHIDYDLLDLKQKMDSGDSSALAQLKEKAFDEGCIWWKSHKHTFIIDTPRWYYQLPPEEKGKYKYSYYWWHPEIAEAFHRGFDETYDHTLYKHFQLPTEWQLPAFVTPLRDAIYTQDRILKWEMVREDMEEHHRDGTVLRDEIVWKLDSVLAFLSEAPEKLAQLYIEIKSLLSSGGFRQIKQVPVPYDALEPGLEDVCRAINALPFAITSGMSGGTYTIDSWNNSSPNFCTINYWHLTIASDHTHQKCDAFIHAAFEISEKYPEIIMRKRCKWEDLWHEYPPIDCEKVVDFFVRKDSAVNHTRVLEKIGKLWREESDPGALEQWYRNIEVQSSEIPIQDAQRKIQQFTDFLEELKRLADWFLR